MLWIDYRERLGLGFDNIEKFERLKNKLITFLTNPALLHYSSESYYDYAIMIGEPLLNSVYKPIKGLCKSFEHTNTTKELISKYIAFINTYKRDTECECPKSFYKKDLIKGLEKSLSDLKMDFEVIKDIDGYFLFPKGANELDNMLVSEPLEWLSEYPNSRKAFVNALRDYSEAEEKSASDVADKFRKALETFFQDFFDSDKSLENLISAYGKYLESHNIPSEIKTNLSKILDLYCKFNNNYAKHHDKSSLNVLEYIMYETGNIIRLLITLKKEES